MIGEEDIINSKNLGRENSNKQKEDAIMRIDRISLDIGWKDKDNLMMKI